MNWIVFLILEIIILPFVLKVVDAPDEAKAFALILGTAIAVFAGITFNSPRERQK